VRSSTIDIEHATPALQDDIFENRMDDLRVPVMPWRNQDTWGCERKMTDVPVIVMENEYVLCAPPCNLPFDEATSRPLVATLDN